MERIAPNPHGDGGTISEWWLRGRLVGRAFRDAEGRLGLAYGIRRGLMHGKLIEYDDWRSGLPSFVDPRVDGLTHGWTQQYGPDQELLIECPFERGTGVDYWCHDDGTLCEEHPLVDGKPSGVERWWVDPRTVYEETHFLDGLWHGPRRHWTAGKLDAGDPRFFIRGRQVSRRSYLAARRKDPTLPPVRAEDDDPRRTLPAEFVRLRKRASSKQARVRAPRR